MSENKLKARFQHATKTESEWKTANPVLLKGEIAYSSDKKKWKTGNGTAKWSELTYDKAEVTKSDVGLGNVDNTADSAKSVKYATSSGSATNALKVNNHTVNADVPSGAKFTDTTYGAASSSLGLVKSGGDVTISNGTITVNDDSHNHVISNIDNLQSSLNAKAVIKTLTSENLNSVTIPGFYNASGGNTVTNKPSGVDNFGMEVIHWALGSYYTQILMNGTAPYRRHCNNGTWSSWVQDKLTDTDTWRGIQNNLTSDSTSDSLSAAQGKVLKGLVDGKGIIGYYGSDEPNVNGWYKVCTVSQSGWSDFALNLLITQGYSTQATGLLHVHTRCDNKTSINVQTFKWMYRFGFRSEDVKIVTGANTWSIYVFQPVSQYGRIQVKVLSKAGTSGDTSFSLSNNNTKESSTPGGMAATDGATVSYANSAGSATTATKATSVVDYNNTESSIQIGFAGAGATTSNLGYIAGYLTGGKQIKDVSKDVLTSWLGLGSLAYSSATIPTSLPANGGNSSTVNGHTVNSDVPANAKFTDTIYTHPTSSGNKHIPNGGSAGQILRWSADGTAVWGADNNTTYNVATTSTDGLMSAGMVAKLNGIATGANKITVDSELNSTSKNPVQNMVIDSALQSKVPNTTKINGKALNSDITLDASDVNAIPVNNIGVSGGIAPLNSNQKIESSYLPDIAKITIVRW